MLNARIPSPATSSSSFAEEPIVTPAKFLQALRKSAHDLHSIVKEVPPSRSPSPTSDKRVELFTQKVRDAYNFARGDPADGKWVHLAEMLRLGCTRPRYKRWATGVKRGRVECGKMADDQIAPEAELEFREVGRKKEGARLHEKVENWKARIDVVSDAHLEGPSIPLSFLAAANGEAVTREVEDLEAFRKQASRTEKRKEEGQAQVFKEGTNLGFPVVKHASMSSGLSKKSKGRVPSSLAPSASSIADGRQRDYLTPSHESNARVLNPTPDASETPKVRTPEKEDMPPLKAISDVSETAFLPPSFPAQLQTSTPPPAKESRETLARSKPPSIPLQSQHINSSPSIPIPLQSKNTTSSHQHVLSAVPPPVPTSSARKRDRSLTPPSEYVKNGLSNRMPPKTPSRPLKKACTMPAISSKTAFASSSVPLKTPAKSTPPKSTPPPGLLEIVEPPSSPPGPVPNLTELLASPEGADDALRKSLPDEGYSLATASNAPVSAHDDEFPASSSSKFTQNPITFAPDFMSTQLPVDGHSRLGNHDDGLGSSGGIPRVPSSSGLFGTGYNSQFDVEGHVDRVSELLERDVDMSGWLNGIGEVDSDPV